MQLTDELSDAFWQALLERRHKGSLNKEDALRCTFFHVLTQHGVEQSDIWLETPHDVLGDRKEIDLLVAPKGERPGLLTEFKFDRIMRLRADGSRQNANVTNRAGALLRDLYRLSSYDPTGHWTRYLIYLTEAEMAGYLSRHVTLRNLINGATPTALQSLLDQSRSKAFGVTDLHSQAMIHPHHHQFQTDNLTLRILEVRP